MQLWKMSMKRLGAGLAVLLLVSMLGGCALFGKEEPASRAGEVASEVERNPFEETAEAAPQEGRRPATRRPGMRRDPFSRSSSAGPSAGQAAEQQAQAERAALGSEELGYYEVAETTEATDAEAMELAGESEGAVLEPGADLPLVGAGPEEGEAGGRRTLWLAMLLVIAVGLVAMWLSRRQAGA